MTPISPLVPFRFFPDSLQETADSIRQLYRKYNLNRIMLFWPPKSDRLVGLPQVEDFARTGQAVAQLKKMLPDKVELNWYFGSTLKTGAGFTSVTDCRGNKAQYSSCPLDEAFKKRICDGVGAFVREAHPAMLLLEDDFQLGGHPGLWFGCCCDLHLAKFNALNNSNYTREDLLNIWAVSSPESIALRLKYIRFCAGTLVDFAREISQAAEKEDFHTRLGICQDGSWPRDGNATVQLARALAGKNRPFVRLYGSFYAVDNPIDFPEMEVLARYCNEHFPEDIECFMEVDTYPHTAYFSSGGKVRTLGCQSLFSGGDDFLYWAVQFANNPLEEKAYLDFWKTSAKKLQVLKKESAGRRNVGPQLFFNPDAPAAVPCDGRSNFHVRTPWSEVLGRMGIPYTTKEAPCTLLSSREDILILSDQEIKNLLAKGLIIDGSAAQALLERGYGEYLGVKLASGTSRLPSLERVLANDEEIYNPLLAPGGSQKGSSAFDFEPLPGAEVLTVYESSPHDVTGTGMVRFVNALGGRIVVIPLTLPTGSCNIFCYRKQRMLLEQIQWCSGKTLEAAISDVANIWLSASVDEKGNTLLLSVVNLSPDQRKKITVTVDPAFAGATGEVLRADGKWKVVPIKRSENDLTFKLDFATLDPVIIKLTSDRS